MARNQQDYYERPGTTSQPARVTEAPSALPRARHKGPNAEIGITHPSSRTRSDPRSIRHAGQRNAPSRTRTPDPAPHRRPMVTGSAAAAAPSAPDSRNTPRSSNRSSVPAARSAHADNAEHAHVNPSDRTTRQAARRHPGTPDPTRPDLPESRHLEPCTAQQKEWSPDK